MIWVVAYVYSFYCLKLTTTAHESAVQPFYSLFFSCFEAVFTSLYSIDLYLFNLFIY